VEKTIPCLKYEVKKLKQRVKLADCFKTTVVKVVPEEAKPVDRGADISARTENGIGASVTSEPRKRFSLPRLLQTTLSWNRMRLKQPLMRLVEGQVRLRILSQKESSVKSDRFARNWGK
jgi:hypothetical protein